MASGQGTSNIYETSQWLISKYDSAYQHAVQHCTQQDSIPTGGATIVMQALGNTRFTSTFEIWLAEQVYLPEPP